MNKIKRDQWHQPNEDHGKHTKNQFQHNNLWPFPSTPINKALSILERSERGTECKQEFCEEPEMYLKNRPLRGAPLACKRLSKCIQDPQKSEDLFTPLPQTTREKKPSKNLL